MMPKPTKFDLPKGPVSDEASAAQEKFPSTFAYHPPSSFQPPARGSMRMDRPRGGKGPRND
jgi:hypothetical protein